MKNSEIWAPAFVKHNNSFIATVNWVSWVKNHQKWRLVHELILDILAARLFWLHSFKIFGPMTPSYHIPQIKWINFRNIQRIYDNFEKVTTYKNYYVHNFLIFRFTIWTHTLRSTVKSLNLNARFVTRVFGAKDCWIYTFSLGGTLLHTYDNYY